jgi:uroporphyrinogen-III synthase
VHNLADLIGKEVLTGLQNRIVIAAAGPVTSAALREYGIQRLVTAADTTTNAVIDALESCFAATPTAKQPLAGAKHG